MDKSWIDLPNRMSREYMDGINHFMEFTNGFDNEFISCPCRKCANRYYYRREHLILNGFLKQYKNWIRHGEEYVSCRREERDEIEVDDMSTWLKHGRKWAYTGHRRFLPPLHRFRRYKVSFDGTR